MTSFCVRHFHGTAARRRGIAAVALLAASAVHAGAQHLTLHFARTEPAFTPLIETAAASGRFTELVETPTFLPRAASKSTAVYGESPSFTASARSYISSADFLPESPSSLSSSSYLASALVGEGDPGQFSGPDPKGLPKAADGRPIAPQYTKYIPAGWAYQPIHGRDKLILGARDLYSPANFLSMIVSAGWSHVTNGQPNYGTDKGAFGQRLGAAALRQTAQGIFTDGVFAVMFHQDPRYFGEGPKYNVLHRAIYAATRPIIVRTTNGTGSTVNTSLLVGYAAATLLNDAYYPASNRNVHDTLASYGGSIGGAALGFVVNEFTDDALQLLHLKHKP